MRKPSPETHQVCRSLLQKAIRRGDADLTQRVASHLYQVGDKAWLQTRAWVICFEECWPLGADPTLLSGFASTMDLLLRAAQSVKVKDAAGLGVLAHALSTGDTSVLSDSPGDQPLITLRDAIAAPGQFWRWVMDNCSEGPERALVHRAHTAYRSGGWPWDRAFMQAAAYLAVTDGVPNVEYIAAPSSNRFPFWIALDKHTPQGREALNKAAKIVGFSSGQVKWMSFYFESAVTNASTESYWWARQTRWRLGKVGLHYDVAREKWRSLRVIVSEILKAESDILQAHLDYPADELTLL